MASAFDPDTGKQWRDRKGRFNRRGTFVAVNRRLIKRRGFRVPKDVERVRVNRERHKRKPWRDKAGEINSRGTYKLIEGSLVKLKGFHNARRLADEEGEALDTEVTVPETPDGFRREASGRPGGEIFTLFRAGGTFGTDVDEYDENLFWGEVEEFGVPAQFYSHHGLFLGQIRWEGRVPLDTLISRLNGTLQFRGAETVGFDFRNTYPRWSYKYQVVEKIGPERRILTLIEDSRG